MGRADQLVAISEFTARYLERLAPQRSVTVMYLGADVERFSPVERGRTGRDPAGASGSRSTRSWRSRCGGCSSATGSTRCSMRRRPLHAIRRVHIVIGGSGPERGEIEAAHPPRRSRTGSRRGIHPGRRSSRLLPGRRRVRAPDANRRRLRPRADGSRRQPGSRRSPPTRGRRERSSTTRRPVCSSGPTRPPSSPAAIARVHDSPELLAAMSRAAFAKSAEFTWDRSIDTPRAHSPRTRSRKGWPRWPAMTRPAAVRPALDARWLGIGGPGRVAEHLLQGFHELEPSGEWVVWGPDAVDPLLWPGAMRGREPAPSQGALQPARVPRAAFGRHATGRVLRASPAPGLEARAGRGHDGARHDPVPVPAVAGPGAADARLHRVDGAPLDTRRDRFRVLEAEPAGGPRARPRPDRRARPRDRPRLGRAGPAAADGDRRAREGALRRPRCAPQEPRSARARLRRQRLRRERGGAHAGRRRRPGRVPVPRARRRNTTFASSCRASSPNPSSRSSWPPPTLLVQPSLEEGFGLPVAEALAAGIPVAMSTAPALLEITRGDAGRDVRSARRRGDLRGDRSRGLGAGRGARPGLAAPGRLRPFGAGRHGTRRSDRSLTDGRLSTDTRCCLGTRWEPLPSESREGGRVRTRGVVGGVLVERSRRGRATRIRSPPGRPRSRTRRDTCTQADLERPT